MMWENRYRTLCGDGAADLRTLNMNAMSYSEDTSRYMRIEKMYRYLEDLYFGPKVDKLEDAMSRERLPICILLAINI